MKVGEKIGGMGAFPGDVGGPKGADNQKEFRPKEKEKEKVSEKEPEKVSEKEPEKVSEKEQEKGKADTKEMIALPSAQGGEAGKMAADESATVKESQAIDSSMKSAKIDAINKLITDNVSDLQVNGQGASLTLGVNAVDIPKVLQGAQIELNLTDQGLTVQFTLAQGSSESTAIKLLEQGDLASLQANLADKGIHLHEMKLGNTLVNLPESVTKVEQLAPKSIFEAERGKEDRGGGKEEKGGKERDQKGRE